MDIFCPSCQERLKELGSSGKFFRCPKEDVLWELCENNYGRHLRTYYTPAGYKGPMIAQVDKIRTDDAGTDGK